MCVIDCRAVYVNKNRIILPLAEFVVTFLTQIKLLSPLVDNGDSVNTSNQILDRRFCIPCICFIRIVPLWAGKLLDLLQHGHLGCLICVLIN